MSSAVLSVRNWERLQHYKDRDPTWVKLYRDLLTTESWVLGTDISRLVQVAIILLAARYKNEIPYRWDLVRKVASLDCSERQFNEAVQHLADTEFLEIQGCHEPQKDVEHDASTTLAQRSTEKRREEESREEKTTTAATRPEEPPEFIEFKAVYPRRAGSQPWGRALKAIRSRLGNDGCTWSQILDGARRYAAYIRACGKERTEYVMQAATFCGPDRHFDNPWEPPEPPPTKAAGRLAGNLSAAKEFMRRTESPA